MLDYVTSSPRRPAEHDSPGRIISISRA